MLDKLFSEITINGKTLKNRCVVNPLLTNFCEEDGTCTERFAAYHEAKAKGGFGMIVTETSRLHLWQRAINGFRASGKRSTSPASRR